MTKGYRESFDQKHCLTSEYVFTNQMAVEKFKANQYVETIIQIIARYIVIPQIYVRTF